MDNKVKKRYQVKPGYRHGIHDEIGPGEVVELTEYEVKPILHKFTPLDESAQVDIKAQDEFKEPSTQPPKGDAKKGDK